MKVKSKVWLGIGIYFFIAGIFGAISKIPDFGGFIPSIRVAIGIWAILYSLDFGGKK